MENTQVFATTIIHTLNELGYTAYFAGGWVRDYLMGRSSADIDIATDAPPEEIIRIFPKTIQVGLTFGVVIVSIDKHLFEVATFRRDVNYQNGRKPEKIELSTPEEDALRRDFTINGMFYDPLTDKIFDFVHGHEDLKQQVIRAIGNPQERFVEDRLRMIRAVRFACRFDFSIHPDTASAIKQNASTLFPAVAMERILQELTKMAHSPRFDKAVITLHELGLLGEIFPGLRTISEEELKRRVAIFPLMSLKTPVVYYLLELFPDFTADALLALCDYLRTSTKDAMTIIFGLQAKERFKQEEEACGSVDAVDWVHFYADSRSDTCIKIYAARIIDPERQKQFIDFHGRNQELWNIPISRIKRNKPLVTAGHLQANGIKPGKLMGELLRAAERMTILHHYEQADEVIDKLKESPLWQY